jgi:hypothetical protein
MLLHQAGNPCNLCKEGSEYFDIIGANTVTYMNQKMTCADVNDLMNQREEDDGEMCSFARGKVLDACCDSKFSLCAGKGLEAGVKVSYEGCMMTCLELDLGLGPAAITAGSEQCDEITKPALKRLMLSKTRITLSHLSRRDYRRE